MRSSFLVEKLCIKGDNNLKLRYIGYALLIYGIAGFVISLMFFNTVIAEDGSLVATAFRIIFNPIAFVISIYNVESWILNIALSSRMIYDFLKYSLLLLYPAVVVVIGALLVWKYRKK